MSGHGDRPTIGRAEAAIGGFKLNLYSFKRNNTRIGDSGGELLTGTAPTYNQLTDRLQR